MNWAYIYRFLNMLVPQPLLLPLVKVSRSVHEITGFWFHPSTWMFLILLSVLASALLLLRIAARR